MTGHTTDKGALIKECLKRFPKTPTATLAKKIYAENPEMFTTVETVRASIRFYRGKTGGVLRDKITDRRFIEEEDRPRNPFAALPDGIKYFNEWAPVQLPEAKTLVIGDLHVPYHDRESMLLALEYGYKENVRAILLLGDIIDFYGTSKWETDPRRRDLWKEIETGREVLRVIRSGFPNAAFRAKQGNHDERYMRYLWFKAPELLNVPDFQYAKFMHFAEHGVELIEDRRILRIGGLHLIHGHEFGRMFGDPVNPARGIYNRGKAHCLCAHWHRTSQHSETSMDGKTISCWSVGCVCDLHPEYMPINKWNHGFAIVENLGGDDEFLVHNHTVVKGKAY